MLIQVERLGWTSAPSQGSQVLSDLDPPVSPPTTALSSGGLSLAVFPTEVSNSPCLSLGSYREREERARVPIPQIIPETTKAKCLSTF